MTDSLILDSPAATSNSQDASALNLHQLLERSVYRRAVEAVIWGMPIVNFRLMVQAFEKAGGAFNQIPFWSRPVTWKNQTLTPNPDTIYLNPFYDTSSGPVVVEIPPASGDKTITGSIDDAWQTALEDVGPAGVDKGAGGQYLILPPDYDDDAPDGYIPLRSNTYRGFVILRSNLKNGSDAEIAEAVAYGKHIRLYPLSQADDPPATVFVDLLDTDFDSTIPYDLRFFELLAEMIQIEPWLTRDKAMIDPLRSLGIEKGKPFNPDVKTKAILEQAIAEAHAFLDHLYGDVFYPPFSEGARWALPARPDVAKGLQTDFADPDSYATDGRGIIYSMAYFSTRHMGQGQFYLMTIRDKAGQPLDGSASYRLRVPADAPVKLYWSATAYDRETHALIREVPRASRGSNSPELQANADGSVDLWFAPAVPAGKEGNWVPTRAGRGFEVLFRLYGPEEPFFKKSWVLPDIERI